MLVLLMGTVLFTSLDINAASTNTHTIWPIVFILKSYFNKIMFGELNNETRAPGRACRDSMTGVCRDSMTGSMSQRPKFSCQTYDEIRENNAAV